MPIHEITCLDCGYSGEVLTLKAGDMPPCPDCRGGRVELRLSAPSSLTGKNPQSLPGPSDTGCCGSRPAQAGCAGPGSCCGKA